MRNRLDEFAAWCGMIVAGHVAVLMWLLYEVWR